MSARVCWWLWKYFNFFLCHVRFVWHLSLYCFDSYLLSYDVIQQQLDLIYTSPLGCHFKLKRTKYAEESDNLMERRPVDISRAWLKMEVAVLTVNRMMSELTQRDTDMLLVQSLLLVSQQQHSVWHRGNQGHNNISHSKICLNHFISSVISYRITIRQNLTREKTGNHSGV